MLFILEHSKYLKLDISRVLQRCFLGVSKVSQWYLKVALRVLIKRSKTVPECSKRVLNVLQGGFKDVSRVF